ncbi:MAG: 1-acyl-sn-glycerol-3-phosphate acyltransferase [Spirochaetota bacterium]
MEPISARYREHLMRMMAHSRARMEVGDNVLQEANETILPFIDKIVEDNLLPGSTILHPERLVELHEAAKRGEPCLLLLEHFSNFDLPVFHFLVRKSGEKGGEIAKSLIAIAGIKLSETNPVVSAFTEAYSRLVIYPSRSIDSLRKGAHDPKELVAEIMRSVTVNRMSMKKLAEIKTQGRLVLVFPSGTRYRPWDPDTRKGVREIDSYVKSFSKMCFVSLNGNILRLNPSGEMTEDLLCRDKVVIDIGEMTNCDEFRARVKHEHHLHEDKKQAVADEIMAGLKRLHDAIEETRGGSEEPVPGRDA